jgi:hypothetical protein
MRPLQRRKCAILLFSQLKDLVVWLAKVPVNKAINVGPTSVTASEAAIKLLRETYKKVSLITPDRVQRGLQGQLL